MKAKQHKSGIDSWTNNGHGIKIARNTPEQQKIVDAINAQKAKRPGADKRKAGK